MQSSGIIMNNSMFASQRLLPHCGASFISRRGPSNDTKCVFYLNPTALPGCPVSNCFSLSLPTSTSSSSWDSACLRRGLKLLQMNCSFDRPSVPAVSTGILSRLRASDLIRTEVLPPSWSLPDRFLSRPSSPILCVYGLVRSGLIPVEVR